MEHGLQITLDTFTTAAGQARAVEVLQMKLDILWTMLDAMWMAYIADMPPFHSAPPAAGHAGDAG